MSEHVPELSGSWPPPVRLPPPRQITVYPDNCVSGLSWEPPAERADEVEGYRLSTVICGQRPILYAIVQHCHGPLPDTTLNTAVHVEAIGRGGIVGLPSSPVAVRPTSPGVLSRPPIVYRKARIGWWIDDRWCPTRKIRDHELKRLRAEAGWHVPVRFG